MDDIIGRERDLARIGEVLTGSRALVVRGEPGIGKTVLLDEAVRQAREQGIRVLTARGSEAERELPFAGLHQLLRPVLDQVDALPERQRTALVTAFGTQTEPAPLDKMLISLAVLTLLSHVADAGPLLLVVDDMHLLDPGSADVVAFLARRLDGEPIGLLAASREPQPLPTLILSALDPASAEQLLDAQPQPPAGDARRQILATAAGNPLALVELGPSGDDGPLTERLEQTFAAHVTDLPEATQRALLIAAAADTTDLAVVQAATGADVDVWWAAERAGLVRLDHGTIQFRHTLVRSAIYGAAPFGARRQAHLALAAVLDDDRKAWHLSAATVTPDETVAALLEAAADRAFTRGAMTSAMHALERAGQLSPDPDEHGRRLAKAAVIAIIAGDMPRAEELTNEAKQLTNEPATAVWLSQMAGTAATFRMRPDEAFTLLLPPARRSAEHGRIAYTAAVLAGINAYYTGKAEYRNQLDEVFTGLDAPPEFVRLWLLGALDPLSNGATVRNQLPTAVAQGDPGELTTLGSTALVVDDTTTAIAVLDRLANPAREDASTVQGGTAAAHLGMALFEAGHWQDARLTTEKLAAEFRTDPTLANTLSFAVHTCIDALSGGTPSITDLLAAAEPAGVTAIVVRARWAAGMAASDHEAYQHFRDMFDAVGAPVHYHLSYYGIADLAAAARPAHLEDARMIVKNIPTPGSPRLAQILRRAKALLADPVDAEQYFLAALEDPLGARWPFERAQLRLDYGEWLRRQRRIADSRTNLTAAREIFERLGAEPWAERARAELRAAGIAVTPTKEHPLAGLSPQRRQIVRLAAEGLTNREIGERLFLSHRTVAFHLYKAFPELGVTTRAQLRDIVDGDD
ncbi:AAA family ATPase [Actinocrispum sp. NPDC049592]|uniref:ATP-binding protein n=1 Tax=Actinocrispum sp. NPDC049592 TaxID=3154835 RepID=UPI003439748E